MPEKVDESIPADTWTNWGRTLNLAERAYIGINAVSVCSWNMCDHWFAAHLVTGTSSRWI
jgi:hypothetical protein